MLINQINSDEVLRRHGAYYTTDISIVSDNDVCHFAIDEGEVIAIDSTLPDNGFSINGSSETWDKFCEDVPPPEFHEPAALIANGHVVIEGDMYAMQSNILYLRRLLEIWRESKLGEGK